MINFKKIASVLTSTVMIGSSVALAAAANFPDPFVKNGSANVAVVWGSAAANTDLVAVADITTKLSSELAAQTATSGSSAGSSTVSGGDFVKLERANDHFNLRDATSDFFSTLDEGELSKVLAKGIYTNDANDDFDFEQSITVGTLNLTHFEDSKFNKDDPMIGFDLSRNTFLMNYTLDFTPDSATANDPDTTATDFNLLETTDLTLLGRTYYIVDATATSNGVKLTLLDSANSALVTEGETKTVQVGANSYDVSIVFIDSTSVKLNVNGVTTNSLGEGDVFKVAADTYVAVKDILARDKTGTIDKVEISIGSGKIVMENNQEVQLNNEDISDVQDANGDAKWPSTLTAHIVNSTAGINSITLTWTTNDDSWLVPGRDLILPGFETVKLSMGDFNVDKQELTTISDSSDAVTIDTTNDDGDLSLAILAANASFSGFNGVGEEAMTSSPHILVTNGSGSPTLTLNESEDSYFVVSWVNGNDHESHAYEISKIDDNNGKNSTTLNNLASSGSDVAFSEVADTKDVGQIRFTLVSANDALGIATIKATPASSGNVTSNFLVTKEGLRMKLPVDSTASGSGNINITNNASVPSSSVQNPTSFGIQFTEEDVDENIGAGNNFNVTVGLDSGNSGTEPTSVTGVTLLSTKDNDVDVGYATSDLASKLTFTNPNSGLNKLEIEYHGTEAFADVFISESGAAVVQSSGGSSTGVQTLGSVSVKDSEVSSVSTKNLIVVGGSCVNTVAAKLLGSDSPLCGEDFTAKTGASSGQYLIQTFASPWSSTSVATLVAGFNAGDTANAAKYLTTQAVDTAVGKKYLGTSETAATASVVSSTASTTVTA